MSLPDGVVRAGNGAIFMLRTVDELQAWTVDALENRWRFVNASLDPASGGLTYDRSYVRNVALAERRALALELRRRAQHESNP
jgi:hypothetical protein